MITCSHCQHKNHPEANFCSNCGAKLEHATISEKELGVKKKRAPERRQLTMLFCDLVDSTALSERLDPEEYRQVITDYHRLAEEVVNEHKGNVANYLGDGLLVYFGYPVGLEDAPRVAVRAGLGILQALDQANKDWEATGKIDIKLRIGIHTGLAVVDEHLALGESVNIAARLEGLAPINGLVISPQTKALITGWFKVKSIGKHTLKGISEPMEVFQVLEETGVKSPLEVAKSKGLTPLVGRDSQINLIKEDWKQIINGQSSMVLVHGEPGIGKSRIIDVIVDHVSRDPESELLMAGCSMYRQNSPFYPLIEMLEKQVFKFDSSDGDEAKLHKLKKSIELMNMEVQVVTPILTEFLSIQSDEYPPPVMSPFAKRQRTISVLVNLLIKYAGQSPMLLILEDLHWADASTLEWLTAFRKEYGKTKSLILCSSRPEFDPTQFGEEVKLINLERLSIEETTSICQHQTRGKILPPEILEEIASKTEGVPLFVEELTKTLIEGDLLVEQEDRYQVVKPVSSMSIPTTLQDSLLARLDRLDEIKEIVQVGSVIGRVFSVEVLNEVMQEAEAELELALRKLMEADILRYESVGAQPVYQFKHSLIQDTAYDSLLRSDRKRIHGQVAAVLENKFSNTSGHQPELLAHHYTEAGELEKAVPLWLQAGQIASKNNATAEAANHLEQGIGLLEGLGDTPDSKEWELDLLLTLGGTYMVSLGFPHPKVKETFDQAREIAQAMGASPKLALIQFNLLSYYFNTEDYQSAEALTSHMMKIAEDSEHGYWFELFAIHLGLGGSKLMSGDFAGAMAGFKKELQLFNPELPFPWELTPSGYIEACVKGWWMVAGYIMGDFQLAWDLCENHLSYADQHKDSVSLYHIYTFPALYKLQSREWKDAENMLDQYLPIVREFGDPVFMLTAEVYYDIARAFQGDKTAFQKVIQSIEFCFQIGFRAFAVTMSPLIGELYFINKQSERGLEFVESILDHIDKSGTHMQTAELTRVQGLLKSAQGHPLESIEGIFKNAIDIAKDQGTKTFELRASCNLAKILAGQGKNQEGHDLVENIRNQLSSSTNNEDLRGAENLLAELAP